MKALCIALICLGTLCLLAYPLIFMANVMSIAAMPGAVPRASRTALAAAVFFWTSTLYPLPYLISLVAAIWNFKKNIQTALLWQAGLGAYLLVVLASFIVWLFMD